MCDCEDVQNMHYAVSKSLSEVKAHKARIKILFAFVSDMTEHDCTYGDNCPIFGSNHGRCTGCKARTVMEKYNAATRDSNSR